MTMKAYRTDIVIDLHDMTPDEAQMLVQRTCRVSGGKSLMIIHGRGKGILRERVRNWGRNSSLVRRVVCGEDGLLPGGNGVTVFFLKTILLFLLCLFTTPVFANQEMNDSNVKLSAAGETVCLLDVEFPLTAELQARLKNSLQTTLRADTEQQAKFPLRIVFRFGQGPSGEESQNKTTFGDAFEFARFIKGKKFLPEDKRTISTIALVRRPVSGFSILPVLACDELIMADNSRLGPVTTRKEDITPAIRMAFEELCQRKGTKAVVSTFLDPATRLYEVETQQGTQWVTPGEYDSMTKEKKVFLSLPKELVFPFGRGTFTASELRRMGMADYLVSSGGGLAELASALGRTPAEIRRVFVSDVVRCGLVNFYGPVQAAAVDEVQRKILDAIDNRHINCLILQIDSAGGSLQESVRLANWLADDMASRQIRLIAWVPNQARNDAVLIPLSCSEIVVGTAAVLGGIGLGQYTDSELDAAKVSLARYWSGASGKNWSLPMAALDPKLDVFHYVHSKTRQNAWFCQQELKQQTQPDDWIQKEPVGKSDVQFVVTGKEALDFELAHRVAGSLHELRDSYGLATDPLLIEPVWIDQLLQTLSHPYWAMSLLCFGFLFLFIELNMPGIGIAAICSAFCFVLYFWASFLGGTAGWLEILLFCFGTVLLLLEIFVIPGFGVTGIIGAGLMIVSFVLASQTFIIPRNGYEWEQFRNTLIILVFSCLGFTIAGIMGSRILAKRFVPVELKEVDSLEKLVDYDPLVGRRGKTTTLLMPSGKAMIDGKVVSVVSEEGTAIPNG
ncbi:MAG: Smr/MutS family protein, partial [Thermoguttaceae bacterium]|nr:Smr/MutS family protein [Thermoguttaceae bacterium]